MMVYYLILFVFLYSAVYFSLKKEGKINLFNGTLVSAFLISVITILFYIKFSDNSLNLVIQKDSFESFLSSDLDSRNQYKDSVEKLIDHLVEKENSEAGELYIVARKLKNINEFVLANQLYRAIYTQYKDELDGDIIAEYAQTLFLSNERKFNDEINTILDHALQKKALNPSALTLKGLSELENNNPDSTIEYWKKAIPLLNSQKEKDELNSLIDAVKKAKNQ